jgi:hypothetical protein
MKLRSMYQHYVRLLFLYWYLRRCHVYDFFIYVRSLPFRFVSLLIVDDYFHILRLIKQHVQH